RSNDEDPLTAVTFSLPLWIAPYLVTQQEYQSVTSTNPSYFTNIVTLPVDTVSWLDANDYCAKLTQFDLASAKIPSGFQYRIPTEAEWEYTCRAGNTNRFNYGADP